MKFGIRLEFCFEALLGVEGLILSALKTDPIISTVWKPVEVRAFPVRARNKS